MKVHVYINLLSVNDVTRPSKFSVQNSALTDYARIFQIGIISKKNIYFSFFL